MKKQIDNVDQPAKVIPSTPVQPSQPVHIVCILDRSGSMDLLAKEVINSFNVFVKEQQELEGSAFLTLVLFDNNYDIVYDKIDIMKVPELTSNLYYPCGMTALYDAIGRTINSIKDEKVMVLIQTDGAENASHEYNGSKVKQMIKAKEAQGWDFIFLGANIDVAAVGDTMGLMSKSMAYSNNASGMQDAFTAMSCATRSYRMDAQNDPETTLVGTPS